MMRLCLILSVGLVGLASRLEEAGEAGSEDASTTTLDPCLSERYLAETIYISMEDRRAGRRVGSMTSGDLSALLVNRDGSDRMWSSEVEDFLSWTEGSRHGRPEGSRDRHDLTGTENGNDQFPRTPWVSRPACFMQRTFPQNMTDCEVLLSMPMFVRCRQGRWTGVQGGQFPDTLIYLHLDETGVVRFEESALGNKEVLVLHITRHRIEYFHEDALKGLAYVQDLYFRHNNWDVRENEEHSFFYVFRHQTDLVQLVLDNNNICLAGVDIASKKGSPILRKLRYLSLKNNNLTRLENNIFYDLRMSPLTDLNLQSSNLRSLSARVFANLPYLEHVDFFDNNFLLFPELQLTQALKWLSPKRFYSLGMGANSLETLPWLTVHVAATNLTRLNLSGNKLRNVGALSAVLNVTAIPAMEFMDELVLRDNRIQDIHENTFSYLPNIKKLDLQHNRLTSVLKGFVLPSLEYLDLSFQCKLVDDGCDDNHFQIAPGVFQPMKQLNSLRLNGLNAETLSNRVLSGLHSLEQLDLAETDLSHIEPGAFAQVPRLKRLNLSGNQNLQGLSEGTFLGLYNLEHLDLSYSSRAFINEGDKTRRHSADKYLTKVLTLKNVKTLNMACSLNENCNGPYEYDSPLNIETLQAMKDLVTLNLANNGLTSWTDDRFVHNTMLATLILRRNSIVFLTQGMLHSFARLKMLDLSQNSVTCNDMVTEFYNMAQGNQNLTVVEWDDGNGYFCFNESNLTRVSYREYALAQEKKETGQSLRSLWYVFIIGGIVLMCVSGGLAYYVYDNRFLVAYYVLKRRLKEKRDPQLKYEYDVFVSYSKDQRGWVTQELLPELEQLGSLSSGVSWDLTKGTKVTGDSTPAKGRPPVPLRACIHERDFQVGATVTENIVQCLDKSRKFLMVLSDEFASSKWCMFEVKLAQSRMISVQKNNLIVVVREMPTWAGAGAKAGIPAGGNETLRDILRTWTYLRWPKDGETNPEKRRTFYKKVRQSVQRRGRGPDLENGMV